MATPHKSEDYKLSAVKHYLTSVKSQEEICDIFKCSARSLMRWVDRFQTEKSVKRHNRSPVAYKVKQEHIKVILEELKKNKTITIEDLLALLIHRFPDLELSRRHLAQVVHDNNMSLKMTRYRHEPSKRFGKDVNINHQLAEFYKEIKKYKLEDIICIDETSINALQKRKHCYSEVGTRCVIKTTSQEVFKRYTSIVAIDSSGVIGWELYDKGGINTERLEEFLDKFITSKYKNKLIILDNASSHRNDAIRTLINKHNKVLYAVPYQHFTNAIENFFSVFKSRLQKKVGITYSELKENINETLHAIPSEIFKRIFQGSYERDEKYKRKSRKRSRRKSKQYKE
jgi:transposase